MRLFSNLRINLCKGTAYKEIHQTNAIIDGTKRNVETSVYHSMAANDSKYDRAAILGHAFGIIGKAEKDYITKKQGTHKPCGTVVGRFSDQPVPQFHQKCQCNSFQIEPTHAILDNIEKESGKVCNQV